MATAPGTVAESLSATGPPCLGLRLDVTDDASVRAGVAQAAEHWGRVDILVNNAGVSGYSSPVWETTDADWQRVLDLNLSGTFRMCRAVVPHMRGTGLRTGGQHCLDLGQGRQCQRRRLSRLQGRHPGIHPSPRHGARGSGRAGERRLPRRRRHRKRARLRPQDARPAPGQDPHGPRRKAREIAALVAFLASPACAFSTGANFDITGGRANIA